MVCGQFVIYPASVLGANSLIPIHDENPTRSFSWLTAAIIVLNVLVFLMEPSLGQPDPRNPAKACELTEFFYQWGTVPWEVTRGQTPPPNEEVDPSLRELYQFCEISQHVGGKSIYLSLVTSMFLHGGIIHIAGNMLFLWVFGNNIEDRLGKVRFLIFYLLCGVLAALAHVYGNSASTVPTVGASGAVAGLLGAYLVLFPRARITTILPLFFFWQIIKLPAMVVLGIWFLSQFLIAGAQQLGGSGVAWLAHVGGFAAGVALIIPFGGRRGARSVHKEPWQP